MTRRRPDGELEVHPIVGWRCPRCGGGATVFYDISPNRICPKCVRKAA